MFPSRGHEFLDSVYHEHPIKHVIPMFNNNRPIIHLGRLRAKFSGTDSLPLAHSPIIEFLKSLKGLGHTIVAEGKRVSSCNFVKQIEDLGLYRVKVVHMVVSLSTAKTRVMNRDQKVYSDTFFKQVSVFLGNS